MSTKPSTHQNTERHNPLWEVRLCLLISLIGLGLAAYAFTMPPADPVAVTRSARSTSLPSQLRSLGYSLRVQNLLRYLRPEPIAPDPALPSIMNYIRVHEEVMWPAFDPAARSTLAYIQAHKAAAQPFTTTIPLDPNARSVYEYLRAHGQLP